MIQAELFLVVYIILVGFVCSGVLSSFWQIWRTEPVGFYIEYDNIIHAITGVLFCVFAGPFIIMRNSLRGRRIEGRPLGWVIAASALATAWSFCTGIFVMHFALSLKDSLLLL